MDNSVVPLCSNLDAFHYFIVPLSQVGWSDPTVILSIFVVIFTAVMALYTRTIARANLLIRQDNQDFFQKQLRAYIGVSSIKSSYISAEQAVAFGEARNRINLVVKNGGQTPAYNLKIHVNYFIGGFNERLPKKFGYPDNAVDQRENKFDSRISLLPGEVSQFDEPIPDWLVNQILAKNETIYIYGHVDYSDVYGISRRLCFCARCKVFENEIIFEAYDEYNGEL